MSSCEHLVVRKRNACGLLLHIDFRYGLPILLIDFRRPVRTCHYRVVVIERILESSSDSFFTFGFTTGTNDLITNQVSWVSLLQLSLQRMRIHFCRTRYPTLSSSLLLTIRFTNAKTRRYRNCGRYRRPIERREVYAHRFRLLRETRTRPFLFDAKSRNRGQKSSLRRYGTTGFCGCPSARGTCA